MNKEMLTKKRIDNATQGAPTEAFDLQPLGLVAEATVYQAPSAERLAARAAMECKTC